MINSADVYFYMLFLMIVAMTGYIVNIINSYIDNKEIQEEKSMPLYITKEIYLD